MAEPSIKAPENPNLLRLAQAIESANRRTKGSPANLLVPTSLGQVLNRWGYGEKTTPTEKLFAAADVGMPGGGPEDLAKLAPLLSIFVGPSRLTDIDLLKKAVDRLDAGDDAAKVWRDTGWGYHPTSGQLISEIDDSKMVLKDRPIFPGDEMPLDDAVSHPELSKVMDTKRIKLKTGVGQGGTWNQDTRTAMVGAKNTQPESYKNVLLHELGHAASTRYGFPTGSNTEFYQKQVEDELRKQNSLLFSTPPSDKEKIADILRRKEMLKAEANQTTRRYLDTSDEALQRLTQARAKYSAADRRAQYPFDPQYFRNQTSSKIGDLFNTEEYGSKFLGLDDLLDVGDVNPAAIDPELRKQYAELIRLQGYPEEFATDAQENLFEDVLLDSANDDGLEFGSGYGNDLDRLLDNAASRTASGTFSLQEFRKTFPDGLTPAQQKRFDEVVARMKSYGPPELPKND